MTTDTSVPLLYRGKINLWIEDSLTREVLREWWEDDPDIVFLIAGGNENIGAILQDAAERRYENVFGYVDRDFEPSNRDRWNSPDTRRFIAGVHEFENFLLDSDALAGAELNTGERTRDQIDARLVSRARELVWWMACRRVIRELRVQFRDSFLKHPKCSEVCDRATAVDFITQQEWYLELTTRANQVTGEGAIEERMGDAQKDMTSALSDGRWRVLFSGKELYRHVRDWIYTENAGGERSKERDIDLAKATARFQVGNSRVPEEVLELRNEMRRKVGLFS